MPREKTKFKEEYCKMLIEHMAQGYSFRSFAAVCKVHPTVLFDWAKSKKKFKVAKEQGEAESQKLYETLLLAAMQGQLKQVKKEKVIKRTLLDENGNPTEDKAKIQEETIEREYGQSSFREASWIFIMKSRFGYTDFVAAGPGGAQLPQDPDSTAKVFQLKYNPIDKPYVVKDKEDDTGS